MHFSFNAFEASSFSTILSISRTISFCPIFPLFSSCSALFSMFTTTSFIFFFSAFSASIGSYFWAFFFGNGFPIPLYSTTLWTYFSFIFRCLLIISASLGTFWNRYSSIISIILFFSTGVISILLFPAPPSIYAEFFLLFPFFPKFFTFFPSSNSSSSTCSGSWALLNRFAPKETSRLLS